MTKKIKKVVYFWYDHCFLRGTGIDKQITNAIERHDWVQFKTYQTILNNMVTEGQKNEKWTYLPDSVCVEYENGKFKCLDMTRELFNKIEDSEYECG